MKLKDVEARFADLVPESRPTDDPKKGDRILKLQGKKYYVDIKVCSASSKGRGSISQLKPIRFTVTAIWAPKRELWYVIPPEDLVRLAAAKPQGNYSEISFESINLSLAPKGAKGYAFWERYECPEGELKHRLEDAIVDSWADAELGKRMIQLELEIWQLGHRYKQIIKDLTTSRRLKSK